MGQQAAKKVEIQGEKYILPAPGKKGYYLKKDRIKVAQIVCALYATDRYPIDECLKAVGINSRSTWLEWQRQDEQIEQLYKSAQQEKQHTYFESLRERYLTTLEREITGYRTKTLTKKGIHMPGKEPKFTDVIETETYHRPSATLLIFVGANLFPSRLQREPQPVVEQNTTFNIQVNNVSASKPARNDEDDIPEPPPLLEYLDQ